MTTSTRRATARTWWALPFLLLPALLTSMDISVLFVASPAISEALAPTATQWLWMMDVYGFVMAGLLITMGSLGDRIGRRRLLLIGAVLFGTASTVIAFATTPEMLIAARALLGVGAATLAPSTLSLIRGMFRDAGQRRAAVGAWTVAFTGGAVAGPIVGGVLLEHFWWGSVFLINIPVMVLLLLTVPFLIEESRDPNPGSFDLLSAAISLIAILALVFAVKHFVEYGVDAISIIALVIGAVFLTLFVRRQNRLDHPLIDLSLLRNTAFSAAAGANTAVSFAAAGLGLLTFTFLQTVHGLGPLTAALWALPTFVGTLVGATGAALLAARLRPAVLLATGLFVGAAGFLVVAMAQPSLPLLMFIGGYTVLTFGIGVVGTLANSLILATAPPGRAGAAAGISETGSELGAALGIATLGTVATGVYRSSMESTAAADTPAAETVTSAVALAEEGVDFRELAFAAYTDSIGVASVVGALVLIGLGIFAAIALRSITAEHLDGVEHED